MDMGREIKFRAYLKDAKEIVEVRHISFFKGVTVVKIYDEAMNTEIWFDLEELELLQYTGLKDTNDKEVYEGDIVKYNVEAHYGGVYREDTFVDKVYFEEGCFWLDDLSLYEASMADDELKIIGNIYENPELLKGEPNADKQKP